VHQSPKDALIQAWYSYVLRESGDTDQAGVVLGRATDFNRRGDYVLPSLMQARFCQKNDLVECARENWQRIYERDLDTLPAVAGLAWVNAQQKSTAEAAKLLNRGLKISPDYIPLLELRQRAENEGWYVAN
jgi:tetratricopeptide (TPR) repeat protein